MRTYLPTPTEIATAAALAAGLLLLACVDTRAGFVGSVHCNARGTVCSVIGGNVDASPRVIQRPAADFDPEWLRVCQPRIAVDAYGVERFQYAKPGCEFGKVR